MVHQIYSTVSAVGSGRCGVEHAMPRVLSTVQRMMTGAAAWPVGFAPSAFSRGPMLDPENQASYAGSSNPGSTESTAWHAVTIFCAHLLARCCAIPIPSARTGGSRPFVIGPRPVLRMTDARRAVAMIQPRWREDFEHQQRSVAMARDHRDVRCVSGLEGVATAISSSPTERFRSHVLLSPTAVMVSFEIDISTAVDRSSLRTCSGVIATAAR